MDETSLKTGLFQQALICPESFTRFNDSAIQASILRAAYPSELNYSSSPDANHDMENLLLKWIEFKNDPSGYALPEFLFSIYCGKLKLRNESLIKILNAAINAEGWIGCFCKIIQNKFNLH